MVIGIEKMVLLLYWFDRGEKFTPSQEQVDAYRNKLNHSDTVECGMDH